MENSPFSLKDKRILVTGASSGIGKVIAQQLSYQGAILVITGRNQKRLIETFDSLHGDNHKMISADVTITEDLNRLAAINEILDGVVFCAGIIDYMPAKHINLDSLNKTLDVNFKSQIVLYQQLHINKRINKGASLVFISSVSSLSGVAGTLAYSASKAAITSSVRVLASELAKLRIRVNSISPGLVETPLLETTNLDQNPLDLDKMKYPLGTGEAIDIANASIFLLSDASRWITGIDLVVDGGYMLRR
nr:SDR family oxidoreductase [uncultured Bacteroides sp.]